MGDYGFDTTEDPSQATPDYDPGIGNPGPPPQEYGGGGGNQGEGNYGYDTAQDPNTPTADYDAGKSSYDVGGADYLGSKKQSYGDGGIGYEGAPPQQSAAPTDGGIGNPGPPPNPDSMPTPAGEDNRSWWERAKDIGGAAVREVGDLALSGPKALKDTIEAGNRPWDDPGAFLKDAYTSEGKAVLGTIEDAVDVGKRIQGDAAIALNDAKQGNGQQFLNDINPVSNAYYGITGDQAPWMSDTEYNTRNVVSQNPLGAILPGSGGSGEGPQVVPDKVPIIGGDSLFDLPIVGGLARAEEAVRGSFGGDARAAGPSIDVGALSDDLANGMTVSEAMEKYKGSAGSSILSDLLNPVNFVEVPGVSEAVASIFETKTARALEEVAAKTERAGVWSPAASEEAKQALRESGAVFDMSKPNQVNTITETQARFAPGLNSVANAPDAAALLSEGAARLAEGNVQGASAIADMLTRFGGTTDGILDTMRTQEAGARALAALHDVATPETVAKALDTKAEGIRALGGDLNSVPLREAADKLRIDLATASAPERQAAAALAARDIITSDLRAGWYAEAGYRLPESASQFTQGMQGLFSVVRGLMLAGSAPPLALQKFSDEWFRALTQGTVSIRLSDTATAQAFARFGEKRNLLGAGDAFARFRENSTVGNLIRNDVLPPSAALADVNPLTFRSALTGTDRYGQAITAGDRFQALASPVDKWNQSLIAAPTQHVVLNALHQDTKGLGATREAFARAGAFRPPPADEPIVPTSGMARGTAVPSARVQRDIFRTGGEQGLVGKAGEVRGPVPSSKTMEDVAAHMPVPDVPLSEVPRDASGKIPTNAERFPEKYAPASGRTIDPEIDFTSFFGGPLPSVPAELEAKMAAVTPEERLAKWANDPRIAHGEGPVGGNVPNLGKQAGFPVKPGETEIQYASRIRDAQARARGGVADAAGETKVPTKREQAADIRERIGAAGGDITAVSRDEYVALQTWERQNRVVDTGKATPGGKIGGRTQRAYPQTKELFGSIYDDAVARGGKGGLDAAAGGGDGGAGYLSRQQRAVRDDLNAAGGFGSGRTLNYGETKGAPRSGPQARLDAAAGIERGNILGSLDSWGNLDAKLAAIDPADLAAIKVNQVAANTEIEYARKELAAGKHAGNEAKVREDIQKIDSFADKLADMRAKIDPTYQSDRLNRETFGIGRDGAPAFSRAEAPGIGVDTRMRDLVSETPGAFPREGSAVPIGRDGHPPIAKEGPPPIAREGAPPAPPAPPRDLTAPIPSGGGIPLPAAGAYDQAAQAAVQRGLERGYKIVGNNLDQTTAGAWMKNGIGGVTPPVLPFAPFHIHSAQFWASYFASHPALALGMAQVLSKLDDYGTLKLAGGNTLNGLIKMTTGLHVLEWAQKAYEYHTDNVAAGRNNLPQTLLKDVNYDLFGKNAFVRPFEYVSGPMQSFTEKHTNPLMSGKTDFTTGKPLADPRDQMTEYGAMNGTTGLGQRINDLTGGNIPRNVVSGLTNPGQALGNQLQRGTDALFGVDRAAYQPEKAAAHALGFVANDLGLSKYQAEKAYYQPTTPEEIALGQRLHDLVNVRLDTQAMGKLAPVQANAPQSALEGKGIFQPSSPHAAFLDMSIGPNGFTGKDLLSQPGNYFSTLDKIDAAKKQFGDNSPQVRALTAELAKIRAADVAQSPGALGPYFDALHKESVAKYGDTSFRGGLKPNEQSAFDAFNDLKASPDYKSRTALEQEAARVNGGKDAPKGSPEHNAYTDFYKKNGDELTRLNNIVNGAEQSIVDRFGVNPKELANRSAVAAGYGPTYTDTTIKGQQAPFAGGATSTSNTNSSRTGSTGTSNQYRSNSSGGARYTTTGRSGSGSGNPQIADAVQASKEFHSTFGTLTKSEQAAAFKDPQLDAALSKGARLSGDEWRAAQQRLERLQTFGGGTPVPSRGGTPVPSSGGGYRLIDTNPILTNEQIRAGVANRIDAMTARGMSEAAARQLFGVGGGGRYADLAAPAQAPARTAPRTPFPGRSKRAA